MIRAMIFDLDGTLVQTEKLKAISYARAAVELCPDDLHEDQAIEAFKEVVGLPRREVAQRLVNRFRLQDKASERMSDYGVETPWQAFIQIRLGQYEQMLADSKVIEDHQWPHNLAILEMARANQCRTGLATMSRCRQATRVLKILNLQQSFDFIASRDDVENGKPDPEIYELVKSELEVDASECLVLEDSPSGVEAAIAAGMWCIAVTTPFTHAGVHKQALLPPEWIVDDPGQVLVMVERMLEERRLYD
ncbi:MAG: HAD family hydrolase [Anaerolineales bacterium]